MFQYVLFDLDGTLTDPKEGITKSVQYALKAFGVEEENLDKLECFIGPPLRDSFMEFYHFDEQQAREAITVYRQRFEKTGCMKVVQGLFKSSIFFYVDFKSKFFKGVFENYKRVP